MEKEAPVMKNCCKDEVQQVQGQQELLQASVDDFNFQKQLLLVSFFVSYHDTFIVKESIELVYNDLSPPDLPINYRILYQSFLI